MKHQFAPYFVQSSLALLTSCMAISVHAASLSHAEIHQVIDHAFQPLMQHNQVPGMAIGVIQEGKQVQVYHGVQSIQGQRKVDENTLFELGSVSKLFTATAGAYALAQGKLSLQDHPGTYWPALKTKPIDQVSLLELATYTSGSLGLQFPNHVKNDADAFHFFQQWKLSSPPGTMRQYSNPSIGLFGELSARAMQMSYSTMMQKLIFPKLQLKHTFIQVPNTQQPHYADGYNQEQQAIRVTPGAFDAQAYGVKSSLPEMLGFAAQHLRPETAAKDMQVAIRETHRGYYQLGNMVQALGWELFPYPPKLEDLLASNSEQVVMQANPVKKVDDQLLVKVLHKTGSTNGFGSYILLVPDKEFALVMLMNKKIPNADRIKAAFTVYQTLNPE